MSYPRTHVPDVKPVDKLYYFHEATWMYDFLATKIHWTSASCRSILSDLWRITALYTPRTNINTCKVHTTTLAYDSTPTTCRNIWHSQQMSRNIGDTFHEYLPRHTYLMTNSPRQDNRDFTQLWSDPDKRILTKLTKCTSFVRGDIPLRSRHQCVVTPPLY